MARILSFDAYRQDKERLRAGPPVRNTRPPHLSDRELWTRDYRETDNIIFAILKIKEILDYHLYYDDVWPFLLLSFMAAATAAFVAYRVSKARLPQQYDNLTSRLIIAGLTVAQPVLRGWTRYKTVLSLRHTFAPGACPLPLAEAACDADHLPKVGLFRRLAATCRLGAHHLTFHRFFWNGKGLEREELLAAIISLLRTLGVPHTLDSGFALATSTPPWDMLPVAHDALSALAIAEAGFSALCVAGYGTSGSVLGLPDIGVLSSTEMLTHYAHIVARVDLPVMVDCDTGFGDVNNVIHTVRAVEQLGAAALFIEDQTFPKRCGHMAGKAVVPVEEYLPKLKAALWARSDPDFVIMARTDAAAVSGIDEAIRRANLYAEAGADMIFVEAVTTVEDMRKVNAAVSVPSMANMIEGGRSPFLPASELQDLGYAAVAYPCASVFTAVKALRKWAGHLKFHGTTAGFAGPDTMLDFEEYFRFIGAEDIREREKQFFPPEKK